MTAKPRALVLRTPGTNCDLETDYALRRNGSLTERIHINRLIEQPRLLRRFQILALPGGFSYGDYISAGKVAAAMILHRLKDAFREFTESDRLILGVCNGFQILVKTGLLPDRSPSQTATLMTNDCGHFVCRWVRLRVNPETVFTRGLPEEIMLPVAHAEGRWFCGEETLRRLEAEGRVAFRYAEPVNGSLNDIAGVVDPQGRILGLMPHPERFCLPLQRGHRTSPLPAGDLVFRNIVRHFA